MTVHRAFLRLELLLLLVAGNAISAQDYVTVDWVNLRQKPSMTAGNLRTLSPGESLFVRTVKPRPGWLPMRTTDAAGLAGWIGKAHVRDLHADTSAAGTAVVSGATRAMTSTSVDHIDPTWEKPAIVQSTICINGGTTACGPTPSLCRCNRVVGNEKTESTTIQRLTADSQRCRLGHFDLDPQRHDLRWTGFQTIESLATSTRVGFGLQGINVQQ